MIVTAKIKYVVMDDKVLFHHLDIHLSSNLVGNQEFQVLWVLLKHAPCALARYFSQFKQFNLGVYV